MSLAEKGVRVDMDYECRSMKSQFRRADRSGASAVVVFGEAEWDRGKVGYRDMAAGKQEELSVDEAKRRLETMTRGG